MKQSLQELPPKERHSALASWVEELGWPPEAAAMVLALEVEL